jgi:hypothetical protein
LRIRITRTRQEEIDGIELGTFGVGMTYEVSPSIATYLVATGSAEIVGPNEPLSIAPANDIRFARFLERARDTATESRRLKGRPSQA